jgi:hypothetical protein
VSVVRTVNKVSVVDVVWSGPLCYEDLTLETEADKSRNYGVYQFYGTHPVLGAETLLYIGRSTEHGRTFGTRAKTGHRKWIEWESHPVSC